MAYTCTQYVHIMRNHIINSFSDFYSYMDMLKDSMPVLTSRKQTLFNLFLSLTSKKLVADGERERL